MIVAKAVLSGSMALPVELIDVAAHKKALTIKYLPMGAEEELWVPAYRQDTRYLHVPRQYGLTLCEELGIEYDDRTSQGVPVTYPKVPEPRDYQIEALDEVVETMGSFYDFLFRARTGWGKTIGSLIVAARAGISTIVIVDQEKLKDQWVDALRKHFGVPTEQIGLVQGKVFRFEGCPVTVAMVQTLVRRELSPEFYAHFGLMIVDEVHIIGAPTFSQILMDFPAAYRIGVSATPKRRDGLQKLLDYNLGKVRVYIGDKHAESSVYVAEHHSVYSWYANTAPKIGRFINEISDDGSRNLLVAEATCMLYDSGRDVLVLSDRIEHLKHLINLCYYLGIPDEDMGLYAGYTPVMRFAKNPNPARRPPGLERGAEYTPVSLQLISKKLSRKVLAEVEGRARIIFGTYGMFSKGADIPRLTGGVDATPRSQAEQVHGRILRQLKGAKRPIWVTIADVNSYRSMHGLSGRLDGYQKNNARVYTWNVYGDVEQCQETEFQQEVRDRVKELKSMRLEQNSVGLNTLLTQSEVMRNERQRATERVSKAQSNHRVSRAVSLPLAPTGRLPVTRSTTPSSLPPSRFLKRQRP